MRNRLSYKIINQLNNISIRTKLLIFFLIVTIIPFIVVSIAIYNNISSRIQEQTLYSSNQMFEQAVSLLNYKLKNVVNTSQLIALNNKPIQEIFKRPLAEYKENYLLQNKDYTDLRTYIESFRVNDEIYKIVFYIKDTLVYSNENDNFMNWNKAKNTKWYKLFASQKNNIQWFPKQYFTNDINHDAAISIVRYIPNLDNFRYNLGLLRIEIKESDVRNILENSLSTASSKAYIINSNNEVICSSHNFSKTDLNNIKSNRLTWDSLVYSNNWNKLTFKSNEVLVKSLNITNTDWKMVVQIPYTDILSTSDKSRNDMFLIISLSALLAYALSFLFSVSLTKRISQLIVHMRKIETGDFNVEIISHSNDEIGQLQKNFNYMLTKIALLMDEKYKLGKDMKNAELKALQAQINPHFLYNTLELISWRSIKKNVPEVSIIVQKLAKFYKLSLSRGNEIVSIENEIEHVKTYVDIQNERFDNSIILEINIDEKLYQFSTLKILLQPLVENSILHGIMERMDESGIIKIEGNLIDDIILLSITDNGVGMTKSNLLNILNKNSSNGSSYGIKNINARIKLHYGDNFGLSFESKPGEGTKVEIRIPAIPFNIDEDTVK